MKTWNQVETTGAEFQKLCELICHQRTACTPLTEQERHRTLVERRKQNLLHMLALGFYPDWLLLVGKIKFKSINLPRKAVAFASEEAKRKQFFHHLWFTSFWGLAGVVQQQLWESESFLPEVPLVCSLSLCVSSQLSNGRLYPGVPSSWETIRQREQQMEPSTLPTNYRSIHKLQELSRAEIPLWLAARWTERLQRNVSVYQRR